MEFLSVEDAFGIHAELLGRTGGTPGILNLGAVASALYRCEWGPFLGEPCLEDRAALLLRGICQDHPFADGNKRTAYIASDAFLPRNHARLAAGSGAVVAFMLSVARDQLGLSEIAAWLRGRMEKDESREVE